MFTESLLDYSAGRAQRSWSTFLSGPPMLIGAAIDAVRQWRYRAYMLNNQPVEVETQISVIFTLSH